MSPCGYVQMFLFGLLCTGAVRAETATCTKLRGQSNIDVHKVYGDWFLGKIHVQGDIKIVKNKCYKTNLKKINESTLELTMGLPEGAMHSFLTRRDTKWARTWKAVGENRTVEIFYFSADGTTMAMASCNPKHPTPFWVLISKRLPISSKKTEEFFRIVKKAGLPGHHHFTWESGATCPLA